MHKSTPCISTGVLKNVTWCKYVLDVPEQKQIKFDNKNAQIFNRVFENQKLPIQEPLNIN